jgi:hypothetical protein
MCLDNTENVTTQCWKHPNESREYTLTMLKTHPDNAGSIPGPYWTFTKTGLETNLILLFWNHTTSYNNAENVLSELSWKHTWTRLKTFIKGTLTREILPLVFFIRARLLTPWFIPQSRFEYKFEFAKIFEVLVDPPVWPPPRDRLFSSS